MTSKGKASVGAGARMCILTTSYILLFQYFAINTICTIPIVDASSMSNMDADALRSLGMSTDEIESLLVDNQADAEKASGSILGDGNFDEAESDEYDDYDEYDDDDDEDKIRFMAPDIKEDDLQLEVAGADDELEDADDEGDDDGQWWKDPFESFDGEQEEDQDLNFDRNDVDAEYGNDEYYDEEEEEEVVEEVEEVEEVEQTDDFALEQEEVNQMFSDLQLHDDEDDLEDEYEEYDVENEEDVDDTEDVQDVQDVQEIDDISTDKQEEQAPLETEEDEEDIFGENVEVEQGPDNLENENEHKDEEFYVSDVGNADNIIDNEEIEKRSPELEEREPYVIPAEEKEPDVIPSEEEQPDLTPAEEKELDVIPAEEEPNATPDEEERKEGISTPRELESPEEKREETRPIQTILPFITKPEKAKIKKSLVTSMPEPPSRLKVISSQPNGRAAAAAGTVLPILPLIGKTLIHSPIAVQIFALGTFGNFAVHRMKKLQKQKSNTDEKESTAETADELFDLDSYFEESEYMDLDDLSTETSNRQGSDDNLDEIEDLASSLFDDDEQMGIAKDKALDKKKKKSNNKKDKGRQKKDKGKKKKEKKAQVENISPEEDSPDLKSKPSKRRGIFGGQKESQLQKLIRDIDALTERADKAESTKDQLEADCFSTTHKVRPKNRR